MKTFAGFTYSEQDIALERVFESDSQPINRNDMTLEKRTALVKNIERFGLKDRIDVIEREDGRGYELVEGHGRTQAMLALGNTYIGARVFRASGPDRATLRSAIIAANNTAMKMTGAQVAEFIVRERKNGNKVDPDQFKRSATLVDALYEMFSEQEAEDFILVKNVGPDTLLQADRVVREVLGLGKKGKLPSEREVSNLRKRSFRWTVKHDMTRAILEHFALGGGHRVVMQAIENDKPLARKKADKAQQKAEIPVLSVVS